MRVESGGHDYEIAAECDLSVAPAEVIKIASFAMTQLLKAPPHDPVTS